MCTQRETARLTNVNTAMSWAVSGALWAVSGRVGQLGLGLQIRYFAYALGRPLYGGRDLAHNTQLTSHDMLS